MRSIVRQFEHSLVLPFLGIGMKIDLFQSCGHCQLFQLCWHIECNTLIAPFFKISKSSAGILSPSLALLAVVLPMGHLTSHFRMSGSGWETTPSWLSGSLRSFLYSSSVYSCHLFLISSASIRSLLFLSFIMPIFGGNVPVLDTNIKYNVINMYLEKKTREKTHWISLFFTILKIGDLSQVIHSSSSPPPPYYKQISNNGWGHSRTQACATWELGYEWELVLKKSGLE